MRCLPRGLPQFVSIESYLVSVCLYNDIVILVMLSSYSERSVRQTPLCSSNSDVVIGTWRRLAHNDTCGSIILSLSPSAIPLQLLAKIDHTLSLAHTHNLPTVTPTQVFNNLELAYRYGRLVPNVYYDSHTPAMDEYDKAFTIYLKTLTNTEHEDRTREELKKCEQCSGN